jgi:sec-independent protein translocase protein TatA
MDNPEIWIALIIVGFLIFGAKRMPDAARGLGRSLRIFKAETKGILTDDEQKTAAAPLQIPATAAAPVYAQPVQQAPVAAPIPAATPAPVPAPPMPAAAPVELAVAQQPVQPVVEHHDAQ